MYLPWKIVPDGQCNARSLDEPRIRCTRPVDMNSMWWCPEHLDSLWCHERINSYKARYACGTKQNNEDFRETRCSVLNLAIESMSYEELQQAMKQLETRLNKVRRCVQRRQDMENVCFHPSRHDQAHANVIVDLADEGVLCENLRRRVSARLDEIEKELWKERDVVAARLGQIDATLRKVGTHSGFRYVDREADDEFGRKMDAKSRKRRSKGKQQAKSKEQAKSKGKEEEEKHDGNNDYLEQEYQRQRHDTLDAVYLKGFHWLPGVEAYEFLVLAAWWRIEPPRAFEGDVFAAILEDERMTPERIRMLRDLVTSPSNDLVAEAINLQTLLAADRRDKA